MQLCHNTCSCSVVMGQVRAITASILSVASRASGIAHHDISVPLMQLAFCMLAKEDAICDELYDACTRMRDSNRATAEGQAPQAAAASEESLALSSIQQVLQLCQLCLPAPECPVTSGDAQVSASARNDV